GEDVVVVEMAVTADSRLINRTLATSGIADLYNTAVLGIHKPKRLIGPEQDASEETRIAEGDVLLVIGLIDDLQEFARGDSLLILDGAKEIPRRSKALLALAIMVFSVATASVGIFPIAIAALGGAILMFVTGCVKFDRVGRALSGKVIVLVAASIAIGSLVLETGAAAWLGDVMALFLQYLPPAAILAAIMLFVTLLTNFASNATAATIGTPIAFNIANTLNLPEEPLILAVLFGCNLCYATPIAYQTNMLIMGEGGYKFGDYIRTGVPLVLLMVTTLSILLVTKYGM
ncbi:MAG: anion permease, partial [Alphaproteobacteria bacterium]|nr:anion permease [Alphaproteobacteria bacterium]